MTDKPGRRKTQFQDLESSIRKTITEYLQPTNMQQAGLRSAYRLMAEDRNLVKEFAAETDDDPAFLRIMKRQAERTKSRYHSQLEKAVAIPSKWETYRYFWDDSKPFPDQGPHPPPGASGPITS